MTPFCPDRERIEDITRSWQGAKETTTTTGQLIIHHNEQQKEGADLGQC